MKFTNLHVHNLIQEGIKVLCGRPKSIICLKHKANLCAIGFGSELLDMTPKLQAKKKTKKRKINGQVELFENV
jgi:hypothetical protein